MTDLLQTAQFGDSITVRAADLLEKHFDAGAEKVFSYEVFPDGLELGFETRPLSVFSPEFGEGSRLLARAMEVPRGATVLDMGTGTGFLGIMAALRGASKVVAADFNPAAVECAKANIERLSSSAKGLESIIDIRRGDLFECIKPGEQFDLVIFNPPFMNTNVPDGLVTKFGPQWAGLKNALNPGEAAGAGVADGLDSLLNSMYDKDYRTLRRFFDEVGTYLKPGGKILLAFSSVGCLHDLSRMASKNGFVMQLVDSMITDKEGKEVDEQKANGIWGRETAGDPKYTFLAYELMPKADPETKNLHNRGALRFTKFYVDLIYGVRLTEVQDEDDVDNQEPTIAERLPLGWAPAYPLFSKGTDASVRRFEIDSKAPLQMTVTVPEVWCRNGYADTIDIPVSLSRFVTLRKDGTCAVTLRFKADESSQLYTMSELLALVMLPPRTLRERGRARGSDERSTIIDEIPDVRQELIGKFWATSGDDNVLWADFSSSFRLLIRTVCEFCDDFRRHEVKISERHTSKTWTWREFADQPESVSNPGIYAKKCEYGDPQVPYVYVVGAVPLAMYRDAFLEEGNDCQVKRASRRKYTKDIAAILGRWLAPHNIPFASADYWQGHDRMQEDAFVSRYMNSLLFTTFSGMAALSLKPDLSSKRVSYREALKAGICKECLELPYHPTVDAIRRCIEMSRLRWHSVITLNQRLDDLLRTVPATKRHKEMLACVEALQDVRTVAAQYLDDPLSSMWDATVGSELAAYLQTSVIERIENEVGVKINLVSRIVQDHWDYIDVRNMDENGLMEDGRE